VFGLTRRINQRGFELLKERPSPSDKSERRWGGTVVCRSQFDIEGKLDGASPVCERDPLDRQSFRQEQPALPVAGLRAGSHSSKWLTYELA
jgi:hypothetical protein